ncbi:hypothetical protein A2Z00_04330 [Candidatus Gottesmanbacteria bacterium RBG_13_45_10]|uniref:Fibronectin type-III domain-containing protein n=1 Tax=Candidatus Gottesmanbacteria bacterium RBG_13_45_10 TaxID=1798370 RepID=A0A1F5ZHR8_9BACT|nr:MAG: hypothetical protein A2Z00_04330 [Candidatus Gottesmanbacteria bacterium RBG_13_45_10]
MVHSRKITFILFAKYYTINKEDISMVRLLKHILFFWVACVLGAVFLPPLLRVEAAVDSCTVSVSPSTVNTNASQEYSFTLNNTSSQTIIWISVTRPSDNFTITSSSLSAGYSSSQVTTGIDAIDPSGSMDFTVTATSGDSEASSANWTVQVSDDGGGVSPTSCTGSLGTAISGAGADTTAPSISDIVVSDISDTQAKISWTTDESGTTAVDYGTTDEYGSSASGDSGTSHSVSISSLTANTTYHYNVKSVDSAGNTGESGDNTFVTAKAGTTTTVTVTGAVTTRTVTATPSPTPTPDVSPPKVTVTTDVTKPFTKAPTLEGTATDKTGVTKLEYSLDAGRNWTPVDEMTSPGTKATAFSFTPIDLLDDNYNLEIRATDELGNTGATKIGTLIIDRLPPMVGGNVISLGPQILEPSANGAIVALAGLDQKITLSAVGGPTEIQLRVKGKGERDTVISLKKNPDNGLWSGILRFDEPGVYPLETTAVDGAGNRKTRVLNSVLVLPEGSVSADGVPVTNGHISVYYLDNMTKQFVLWDGSAYSQENPQPLSAKGKYKLYLPVGTYYLRISAPGFKTQVTGIFTLDHGFPVTPDFLLKHARALRLGPFLIPLPDFSESSVAISLQWPEYVKDIPLDTSVVGSELPYFSFPFDTASVTSTGLHGKPTVITFFNTWSPEAATQLAILNDVATKKEINVLGIVPQETSASVAIFRKRGAYAMPIVADPDGSLVDALHLQSLPTHIFLNRKGIIQGVQSGVLSKEQILDGLLK